ncbi:unnamed protein product, partial [Linum tenue]
ILLEGVDHEGAVVADLVNGVVIVVAEDEELLKICGEKARGSRDCRHRVVSGIALPSGSDKLYTGSQDVTIWDCHSD